jgi:hypothetical protein
LYLFRDKIHVAGHNHFWYPGAKNHQLERGSLAYMYTSMTSFQNVNIRKISPQKVPATFGTLNVLLQLRYQTISSFTAPEFWVLHIPVAK